MVDAGTLLFFCLLSLSTATARPISDPSPNNEYNIAAYDSSVLKSAPGDTIGVNLITFAQTLKGIPYRYGCSHPKKGFDCSGFVMYVFNHFQINVPRSSIDFTNIGKEIDLQQAVPGDIILFTGTDSSIRKVGHVGIVTKVDDALTFIHASSGKTAQVIETVLNPHYKKRFIKVIRVLP